MEVSGQVAIVTGAATGIGRASAVAFARAGAAGVVVADVDEAQGARTVELVEKAGAQAIFVRTDVSDRAALAGMFAAAESRFGTVGILHNNAGVMSGEPAWPDSDPDSLVRTIGINLTGTVLGIRLGVDVLARGGGGAIVNTCSRSALSTNPFDPVYAATKAAVASFTTSCAALAASHAIRVNAVLPGVVETPILAKTGDGVRPAPWLGSRIGQIEMLSPESIAEVVLELVADDDAAGVSVLVDNPPRGTVRLGKWIGLAEKL